LYVLSPVRTACRHLHHIYRGPARRPLGPGSAAWRAWEELSGCLKNAGARAPFVGASKLLAAKRLRLAPLDDGYVRRSLTTSRRDIWKVIHCIVRDPQVREGLGQVGSEIPSAGHITLHRTLDTIVARWRRAGYADTGRLGPGSDWCWPTRAEITETGLGFPATRPALGRLAHIRAVLAARLWLQASPAWADGQPWWHSERRLRADRPVAGRREYVPDAEIH
jgi:hypothetical protein